MKPRALTAGTILAALMLLSACSDGSDRPAADGSPTPSGTTPAPAPNESATAASRCPNQLDAVAAGERAGGKVEGDVDGDGAEDVVYVVRDADGPPGCQTFVVAEVAGEQLAAPAEEPDISYGLQAPRVNSLVEVDGSPGLEILVDLEQGASTQFLGMFKVHDGSLERVRIGGGSAYGNLFPYGGSVGHIEASNCSDERGAEVLIAIATPNVTDYTIRTVLYEMRGTTLLPLPLNEQSPVFTGPDVEASEGFDSSPFGDCRRS